MRLEGEVAKDSSLRCGKKILEFQLIFILNFYFVTAIQWNNIFNSIHIFSICMQYSLLNIPEGCVRLDSLETGFEVESCTQRLIGSARGWYACQEERGQAVTKPALGPLAHCAAKPIYWHQVDLENIFPVSLFWAIMGSFLTNEFHLTFSPICSLSSNCQELRVFTSSSFSPWSFNLHESSITFPVLLGGHGVALWSEWRSQSWTDSGFLVQVYILGWLANSHQFYHL